MSVAGVVGPVASVAHLEVLYPGRHGRQKAFRALTDVTLEISPGETLGVVGESGAGKTTLGRVLIGLVSPSSGEALFLGRPVRRAGTRGVRGRLQVVPQNPDWSLNPHWAVWLSVAEPLAITHAPRSERRIRAAEALEQVGLSPGLSDRKPHQLSGGQRQRVAIARAIVTHPDLIVFDEAVTALDASVQAQVLNLIRDLQAERRFAALFISHDLAAVRYVAQRIAVFREGRLIEIGPTARFYGEPDHPYSRDLVHALSVGDPRRSA